MKQIQPGQLAFIIALVLIFITGIAGLYIYSQDGLGFKFSNNKAATENTVSVPTSAPTPTPAPTATPTNNSNSLVQSNVQYITYTAKNGLYSFNYPSTWNYEETPAGVSFFTLENNTAQIIISVSVTEDLKNKLLSFGSEASTRNTSFGSMSFGHLTYSNQNIGMSDVYYLPLRTTNDITSALLIGVFKSTKISNDIVARILSSIKTDPTKLGPPLQILTVEQNTATMNTSQIRAALLQFALSSELYFDANNYSYAGMCNKANSVAIKTGISETLTMIEGMVKTSETYCNSSAEAYVYSAPDSPTSFYCVDSTGYRASQATKSKTLACK